MADDNETIRAFARLEAAVESSRKQAAESAESRERSAVARHASLESEVRTLKTSHANLALSVRALENKSAKSGEDLSEHIRRDDTTTAAISRHIQGIEHATKAIDITTNVQNVELDTQTKLLRRAETMRSITPIITAVASALAAYFASR